MRINICPRDEGVVSINLLVLRESFEDERHSLQMLSNVSGFKEPGEARGDGWRLTVPSPELAHTGWAEHWVELPAGSWHRV